MKEKIRGKDISLKKEKMKSMEIIRANEFECSFTKSDADLINLIRNFEKSPH